MDSFLVKCFAEYNLYELLKKEIIFTSRKNKYATSALSLWRDLIYN